MANSPKTYEDGVRDGEIRGEIKALQKHEQVQDVRLNGHSGRIDKLEKIVLLLVSGGLLWKGFDVAPKIVGVLLGG